jgi:DNA-binding LytR/AlgR family response regulator
MSNSNKLSCVIIEDDPVAMMVAKVLIQKTPLLDLKQSFTSTMEATTFLREEKIDVAFVDVEMPELSGLQLIEMIDPKTAVIIISNKEQYAVNAFELNVCDYLLKPLNDYPRFLKAVLKAKDLRDNRKEIPASNVAASNPLFVKVDSLLHNIQLDAILWIEAYGDYVKINTEQKMLMVLSTLKAIEGKLPENQFTRVHRSFIVNIKRIENIDPNNLQIGSKIIPVSSNYREGLLNKISLL